jgi:hypothetical protein
MATRHLPLTGQAQFGIVAGSCLEENHKVLTADLRYVPLKEVNVGDELVSFEEYSINKRSRRYKKGTVLAVKSTEKETFKVTLESGKEFVVTDDHRWLVRTGSMYRWVETNSLRKGTCIPKLMDEWETLESYDAGWLSGMYDGEGSLHQRKTTRGFCVQLSICQKVGETLNKLVGVTSKLIGEKLVTNFHHDATQVTTLRVKGGVRGILHVLGSVRPSRLLAKFDPNNIGSIACSKENNDKVVSIVKNGLATVREIDIDAKTMIVEGYGHHNCYEHDEDYKGHTGNFHFRGILVLNEVQHGSFDPMVVSLNYLKRNY